MDSKLLSHDTVLLIINTEAPHCQALFLFMLL